MLGGARRYWGEHFLFCEAALAVAVTAGLAAWCEWGGKDEVSALMKTARSTLYPAIISAFGSLFGFVITTMSIILTWADKKKFVELRGHPGYTDLWPTFLQTVYTLGAGTLIGTAALLFDQNDRDVPWIWYVEFGLVVLATFRLARCVWILRKLIEAFSPPVDPDEDDEPPAP